MYEPDPEDFNSRPSPSQEQCIPRRPRARSEMGQWYHQRQFRESDCETNPRKAKFLALKRRSESTHLPTSSDEEAVKRARLFPPGPAHPPKNDNVAKRPPAMLETDQDFPITIKATL